MKIYDGNRMIDAENRIIEPLKHRRPEPPHIRKSMLPIEFDDNDWVYLNIIFGDEDSAKAAADIIRDVAPPEIRILAIQIMDIIETITDLDTYKEIGAEKSEKLLEEERAINCYGFSSAVLTPEARFLYNMVYGKEADRFIDILDTSPNEISVISRMIVFMKTCLKGV